MPAWRDKPPAKQNFTKRRSVEANRALIDAAHRTTYRLYCDALRFWRFCRNKKCKRHRRCCGEPTGYLKQGLPAVPPAERLKARQEVMAGGPRREATATHIERAVRQSALEAVLSWRFW